MSGISLGRVTALLLPAERRLPIILDTWAFGISGALRALREERGVVTRARSVWRHRQTKHLRVRVRIALRWAVAGAVIPFGLMGLEPALRYLNPHYLGLGPATVLVLWPSSLFLMALHGSGWDLTAGLFFSVVFLINVFLSAVIGFILAPAWKRTGLRRSQSRTRAGRRAFNSSRRNPKAGRSSTEAC